MFLALSHTWLTRYRTSVNKVDGKLTNCQSGSASFTITNKSQNAWSFGFHLLTLFKISSLYDLTQLYVLACFVSGENKNDSKDKNNRVMKKFHSWSWFDWILFRVEFLFITYQNWFLFLVGFILMMWWRIFCDSNSTKSMAWERFHLCFWLYSKLLRV